jgi:hypothetical protein
MGFEARCGKHAAQQQQQQQQQGARKGVPAGSYSHPAAERNPGSYIKARPPRRTAAAFRPQGSHLPDSPQCYSPPSGHHSPYRQEPGYSAGSGRYSHYGRSGDTGSYSRERSSPGRDRHASPKRHYSSTAAGSGYSRKRSTSPGRDRPVSPVRQGRHHNSTAGGSSYSHKSSNSLGRDRPVSPVCGRQGPHHSITAAGSSYSRERSRTGRDPLSPRLASPTHQEHQGSRGSARAAAAAGGGYSHGSLSELASASAPAAEATSAQEQRRQQQQQDDMRHALTVVDRTWCDSVNGGCRMWSGIDGSCSRGRRCPQEKSHKTGQPSRELTKLTAVAHHPELLPRTDSNVQLKCLVLDTG